MIELQGKYNKAMVYTDNIEQQAKNQIIELCSQEFCKGSKIRIMPDVHAGAGCTIGTTMTIKDKVVPNLVGVDISCGMETVKLKGKTIDFKLLDDTIRKFIPSGQNVRGSYHIYNSRINLNELRCKNYINLDRAMKSIGTLGGGNHFIEVDKDKNDNLYLVIHSGSRYLGKQVAEYYQELAYTKLTDMREEKQTIIKLLKSQGREKEIQSELKKLQKPKINKALAYLQGQDFNDYIHDIEIVQKYAMLNRFAMANEIISRMELDIDYSFTTLHNYIDIKNMILRKGSISAQKGEKVLIPINMRDGSIIGIGKGNSNWNYSAPHGAGRIMSRRKAKELVTMAEYEKSMNGIYTTSVNKGTIDEAPMVYKSIDEIIENIKDSIDIIDIIKPGYNFKAGSDK